MKQSYMMNGCLGALVLVASVTIAQSNVPNNTGVPATTNTPGAAPIPGTGATATGTTSPTTGIGTTSPARRPQQVIPQRGMDTINSDGSVNRGNMGQPSMGTTSPRR